MNRRRIIGLLNRSSPGRAGAHEPPEQTTDALDSAGVQAFAEQARWMYSHHDRRSDTFGQRASTILAFDGALLSVVAAGVALVRGNVEFMTWITVNLGVLIALPIISAYFCLVALTPRQVTIPDNQQLREQWKKFYEGDPSLCPPAQVVHAFLGGLEDPIASAAGEADSRGRSFTKGLYFLLAALVALGALAIQLLVQSS